MEKNIIYLVDDEEALLEIYTDILSTNYEVRTFLNPLEMLKAINDGQIPDVIATDLNMPDMDGVELLCQVRGKNIQAPAILFSGYADQARISRALQLHSVKVIEKPFTNAIFRKAIEGAVLESSQQKKT